MSKEFEAVDRNGRTIVFEMAEPDSERERAGEIQRLKAYSEALKEGILPREAMRTLLREKGVWDDEDDKEFTDHIRRVAGLERELNDATARGNNEKCTSIAGDLSKARLAMLRSFMVANTVLMNSCEGYAEAIKLEAMMASCVLVKDTKEPYWKSYREYVIERDCHPISTVASEAQACKGMIEEEQHNKTVERYPEHEWLKQMNADLVAQIKSELERAKEDVEKLQEGVDQDGSELEGEINRASDKAGEDDTPPSVDEGGTTSSDLDTDRSA